MPSKSDDETVAVVVGKFECGRFRAHRQNVLREMSSFEFGDGLRVNGLRFRRDIFRDQFLTLGKDLAQRTRVSLRARILRESAISSEFRASERRPQTSSIAATAVDDMR